MSKLPTRQYLKFRELKTGLHKLRGRFVPSPKLRAQGYKSFDLLLDGPPYTAAETRQLGFNAPIPTTRTGRPANYSECIKIAERLNALINGLSRSPANIPKPKISITRPTREITLAALIDDYQRGDHFARLAPKTRMDYKTRLRHVAQYFKTKRPHDLDEQTIEDFFYNEKRTRGHRSAYGEFQCLRLVMKWGLRNRLWKTYIPYLQWDLGIPSPPLRMRIISEIETAALLRAADDPWSIYNQLRLNGPEREIMAGKQRPIEPVTPMPSIADAIIMAQWTAQRPTDTLLAEKTWVVIKDGVTRYQVDPNKTATKHMTNVDIPVLPPLAKRLTQIHKRHLKQGWTARPHFVLSDTMGKPYLNAAATQTTFPKAFAKVRRLAARIQPSVADVTFKDYRTTAITCIALKTNASLLEIQSWTGHKNVDSMAKVLKHYIGKNAEFADKVGAKLMAQYNAGG